MTTPTPPAMKDNPAMRAAEKIVEQLSERFYDKTWQETKDGIAAIIAAEYSTERRECVSVMKEAATEMDKMKLSPTAQAAYMQLRELIGKLGE